MWTVSGPQENATINGMIRLTGFRLVGKGLAKEML
jgi:hypothetical protein